MAANRSTEPDRVTVRAWIDDPRNIPVAELSGPLRWAGLLCRNLYWGRTHGWSDLIEEHDLNPLVRVRRGWRKVLWRAGNCVGPGEARPILLFGAQRSGTNMVTHGLSEAPQFEVFNEGNPRAFANYRLRPEADISALTLHSRHRFVLFKPLLDSHLAARLLDDWSWPQPPRAIWVYRDVVARARSAVAKFGDSNLRVLKRRAESESYRHWQLGDEEGLSEESEALLDSFDPKRLTALDGAALFWLVRNRLYFELGLDRRDDVVLVGYEGFIARPEETMGRLCATIGLDCEPRLVAHVRPRIHNSASGDGIDARILALCRGLAADLHAAEVTG